VQEYAGVAQTAVVGAVGSVAGAVGLGGAVQKEGEMAREDHYTTGSTATAVVDKRLAGMDQAQIEEFLRAKNSSVPETLEGKKVHVGS
jgi:hypothetical protein